MTERERLMKRISSYDFAVIELHIYLDTHPNDKAVAEKLADYNQKSMKLRKEYEEKFGPIQAKQENANRWAWISNPWPWDNNEEGK